MVEVIINIDTSKVIKEQHICWNVKKHTREHGEEYWLYEIVQRFYDHPQANDYALLPIIEEVLVRSIPAYKVAECSHLIQLEASNNTVSQIEKLILEGIKNETKTVGT